METFTKPDGVTLGHSYQAGDRGCGYLIIELSDGTREFCSYPPEEHGCTSERQDKDLTHGL